MSTQERRLSTPTTKVDQINTLKRSSTMSKLKRYGSKLISRKSKDDKINNSNNGINNNGVIYKEPDSYVPPNVPTDESLNSVSLSLTTSSTITEESEEEILVTPTTSTALIPKESASIIETLSTHVVVAEPIEQEEPTSALEIASQKYETSFTPVIVPILSIMCPHTSQVRSQLQFVFDQVDKEVEEEFEISRKSLHQALHKPPRYLF
jgi:hypothetical protein